jgi:hypothetical protein
LSLLMTKSVPPRSKNNVVIFNASGASLTRLIDLSEY